ncbi:MAG: leucine-rich repeat protein [Rikenellaceae bacterium]
MRTVGAYVQVSLAALLVASSCSTDMESVNPVSDSTMKLSLNASVDPESRVSVDGTTVKWANNDVIYANSSANRFVASAAGANATFEGELSISESQPLYVVFDAVNSGANFSADGTTYTISQSLNAAHNVATNTTTNTATLGKYLFLYGVTEEVDSSTTSIDVIMKHGLAVQDFSFTNLDFSDEVYLATVTLTSDEPFLTSVTYDIATGEQTPGTSTIYSIPLSISTSNATGGAYAEGFKALTEMTVRMPILPQTIAETATWTLSATMTNGDEYTYTFPKASSSFEYVAGTCYDIAVDLEKMDLVKPIVEYDVTTFTAADVAGQTVWYFSNATLAAGDVNNLNTILGTVNAQEITVVFNSLTPIVANLFQYSPIVNLELPSAKTINASAFAESKLQRLSAPVLANNLGANAFDKCVDLVAINAPDGEDGIYIDDVAKILNYVFRGCTSITKVSAASAASLGTYVFNGCNALVSVSADIAASSGAYVFGECAELVSVYAPLLTSFGNNTFRTCPKLTSFNSTNEHPGINLEGITSTADYAFRDCASITNIYAPDLTYLGAQIFAGLESLETLEVATNSDITMVTAGTSVFVASGTTYTTTTSSVALTTGAKNGTTVNGAEWSVVKNSDSAATFIYTLSSIETK